MTGTDSPAERIRAAFRPTPRGVVGLVDDLVRIAREHPLALDHAGDRCRVLTGGEEFEVPLPRSAFRAALARLAALCGEHAPGSVTPYGGTGELPGVEGAAPVRVAFTNTPADLRAELEPTSVAAARPLPNGAGRPGNGVPSPTV